MPPPANAVIRVFAHPHPPTMEVLEIQGSLSIQDEVRAALHDEQKQHASCDEEGIVEVPLGRIRSDNINPKRCTLVMGTLQVDGSRGHYPRPILVLRKRARSLEISTSSDEHKHIAQHDDVDDNDEPMLLETWMAKQKDDAWKLENLFGTASCSSPRQSRRREGDDGAAPPPPASPPSSRGVSSTTDVLANNTAAEVAQDDVQDYNIVGVVRDFVLINSKPARVLSAAKTN